MNFKKENNSKFSKFQITYSALKTGFNYFKILIKPNFTSEFSVLVYGNVLPSSFGLDSNYEIFVNGLESSKLPLTFYNPSPTNTLQITRIHSSNENWVLKRTQKTDKSPPNKIKSHFKSLPAESTRIVALVRLLDNYDQEDCNTMMTIDTNLYTFRFPIRCLKFNNSLHFPNKIDLKPTIFLQSKSKMSPPKSMLSIQFRNLNSHPLFVQKIQPYSFIKKQNFHFSQKSYKILPKNIFNLPITISHHKKSLGLFSGVINFMIDNNKFPSQVFYQGEIIKGGIKCDNNSTNILTGKVENIIENKIMDCINDFNKQLIVFSVSSNDPNFQVLPINPQIIERGNSISNLSYNLNKNLIFNLNYVSEIELLTNFGIQKIQINFFTGELIVKNLETRSNVKSTGNEKANLNENEIPKGNKKEGTKQIGNKETQSKQKENNQGIKKQEIDFGIFSTNKIQTKNISIYNPNIQQIEILNIETNFSWLKIFYQKKNLLNKNKRGALIVKPNEIIFFSVKLKLKKEQNIKKYLNFVTLYQNYNFTIIGESKKGNLTMTPNQINININSLDETLERGIYLYNYFQNNITITNIACNDQKINVLRHRNFVKAQSKRKIGKIIFEPSSLFDLKYFVYQKEDKKNIKEFIYNLKNYQNLFTKEIQKTCLFLNNKIKNFPKHLNILYDLNNIMKLLIQMKKEHDVINIINTNITMESDKWHPIRLPIQINYNKPKIIFKNRIHFKKLPVQYINSKKIYVYNPSNSPLEIEVFPFVLKKKFFNVLLKKKNINFTKSFFQKEQFMDKGDNGFKKTNVDENDIDSITYSNIFENAFQFDQNIINNYLKYSTKMKKADNKMLIPPKTKKNIGYLHFQPKELHKYKGYIIIKNNLTILDYCKVTGLGGEGILTINDPSLNFEITNTEFLDQIDSLSINYQETNITNLIFKRNIIISNSGNLPIKINTIKQINNKDNGNSNCGGDESYGIFLNYRNRISSIIIPEKKSMKIPIIIKPNYSKAILQTTVIIESTHKKYQFQIKVNFPKKTIKTFSKLLPLTAFEILTNITLISVFIIVNSYVSYNCINEILNFKENELMISKNNNWMLTNVVVWEKKKKKKINEMCSDLIQKKIFETIDSNNIRKSILFNNNNQSKNNNNILDKKKNNPISFHNNNADNIILHGNGCEEKNFPNNNDIKNIANSTIEYRNGNEYIPKNCTDNQKLNYNFNNYFNNFNFFNTKKTLFIENRQLIKNKIMQSNAEIIQLRKKFSSLNNNNSRASLKNLTNFDFFTFSLFNQDRSLEFSKEVFSFNKLKISHQKNKHWLNDLKKSTEQNLQTQTLQNPFFTKSNNQFLFLNWVSNKPILNL
ncbi:rw1 protein [Anaeramoeba flamelloides]|uniref:Rw1 protein n=1 Tax=Anaeramoeba flamelloides TaxID=1746091 RepID=A0ABQ8YY06_9EUKA|nr:rw1 protein [Anaeramoeba flamelloides]